MRLFYNLNTDAITIGLFDSAHIATSIPLKSGQDIPIQLQFHRNGVPELLPSSSTVFLGIKPCRTDGVGEYDASTYLTSADTSAWSPATTTSTAGAATDFYTATLTTLTSAIDTALAVDADITNDLTAIDPTIAEIEWKAPAATRPAKSQTFSFRIANRVNRGTEVTSDVSTYDSLVGELKLWGGSSLPSRHLWCDGAAVSRTTYSALFAVIGTGFGAGNGTTTFNLPDLRGRVPAGIDNMGSGAALRLSGATIGAGLGNEFHELTIDELPLHFHTQPAHTHTQPAHTHNYTSYAGVTTTGVTAGSDVTGVPYSATTLPSGTTSSAGGEDTLGSGSDDTSVVGGGQAHTSVQPSLCVKYIIRY